MPFRPSSVVVHPDVQGMYNRLETSSGNGKQPERSVWKALNTAVIRIKADGLWGEVIPKSSIPVYFVSKYDLTNLYCVDLPAFHRVFYTIRGRDVVMLDLVDHKVYDRLMQA